MSSFEAIGWVLLSAFCLHQMKIMDVPQTFKQYTGIHLQQVSSDGSQQNTGQPAENRGTAATTEPNPEGTEAGKQEVSTVQP